MSFWDKLVGKPPLPERDLVLKHAINGIVGKPPKNLELFKLATLHSSISKTSKDGFKESNERLEYLGDAVLNMVIAEYLFKKYPFKDEGFLTEVRSRIVKRESLNHLAKKLGIHKIVQFQDKDKPTNRNKSIYGNALEAIIGAVFLDGNYLFCKSFILNKIVMQHLDMKEIIQKDTNYKSRIIEWGQKENKEVIFDSRSVETNPPYNEFIVTLIIDNVEVAVGTGSSKKRAEQDAALKACEALKLP